MDSRQRKSQTKSQLAHSTWKSENKNISQYQRRSKKCGKKETRQEKKDVLAEKSARVMQLLT